MKERFFGLADALCAEVGGDEILLLNLAAERSDFVRFNRARVRQAGSVEQRYLTLRVVRARRQASATLSLSGDAGDVALARKTISDLRDRLRELPEDPWLLVSEEPASTTTERRGRLPPVEAVIEQITRVNRDVVAFYAAGTVCRAFANSLGQRNWHEVDTFNVEWSLYLRADKAIKETYAGFDWDAAALAERLAASEQRVELLALPPRSLEPGEYRAYLAPRAVEEIMKLLTWDGFSARARATRQTPLLRLDHGDALSPKVSIAENTGDGVAPRFQQEGFVRPERVQLIDHGALAGTLVSPRSAQEYALAANGANSREMPESLDMAPGDLPHSGVLAALDTGLYIGNLWYLNFSDRPAGRITGMTRFATFWAQNGRIVAPVNALRFDDTVYRTLGENVLDLTSTAELMLDSSTYDERSTSSMRLPGALLSSLRFTL